MLRYVVRNIDTYYRDMSKSSEIESVGGSKWDVENGSSMVGPGSGGWVEGENIGAATVVGLDLET